MKENRGRMKGMGGKKEMETFFGDGGIPSPKLPSFGQQVVVLSQDSSKCWKKKKKAC